MRKKRPLPLLRDIAISGVAAEGKAIARHDDLVVFIPFAAPGDIADIQITKRRRRYLEGRITELKEKSDLREVPFCKHFGICGGCKWQHLSYEYQLQFKQQQVLDHFTRIGKLDLPDPEPILPSPKTQYYRNKLEFTFTNRRWLTEEEVSEGRKISEFRAVGFHIPGRFDKVIDLETCYLQQEPSNEIREAIKEFAIKEGLEFFDLLKQTGFLRTLIIRTSSSGELMVIVVFCREDLKQRESLMNYLMVKFPAVTSLMYVINPKANDTISDLDVNLYHGRDHIIEEMDGLKFRVGPKSFYQTNTVQALELYKLVRDFADPGKNEVIYDLYSGTGTIAAFMSRHCRMVYGLEYVPEAVEDARFNARINGLNNTGFFAGDIKELLTPGFIKELGVPDTVITDPPRTGMHQTVIERIMEISPSRIVYVSCNSSTQARDIKMLDQAYKVERLRAVDMFPHTHHIESVALLVKRESALNS